MKKGGKMHIFSPIAKKYIFTLIFWKLTKLQKKGRQFFTCGAHPLNIKNVIWGKNNNQEEGGGGKEFKI